jgi:membrane-associated protease RseP (regulator of RpoE activity)
MGNQAPQINDPRVTDPGDEKIIQLLSALPRVEAPGDFGFRVKAGIAQGKPASGTSLWMPTAVKAALPLMLLVLVGGYFAVTTLYTTIDTPASVVAMQEEAIAPAADIQDRAPVQAQETVVEQSSPPTFTARVPDIPGQQPSMSGPAQTVVDQASTKKRSSRNLAPPDGSRSKEEAALITRELSKANDTVPAPETSAKGERAGEVLTRIGINALFGESGWKAESVSPNTAAAKAGVKAGDIIESVDDQKMNDLGSVARPAKGKKLRVLREGKSVDIVIDP